MASVLDLLLFLSTARLLSVGARECLRPANNQGVIPFGNVDGEDRAGTPTNGRLVIVMSYQFHCCGSITRWQTYVHPFGNMHSDGVYSIQFYVWRQSTPGADDGCYVIVGEDNYENIVLSGDLRGLVDRTVPQPSNLTVQPGDVVGFFVYTDGITEGSIQFNENAEMGFDQELAYYNSDFLMFQSDICPFPVGAGRILDVSIRAAPVLSLDIDQIPCSTTQSSTEEASITSDSDTSVPTILTTTIAMTEGVTVAAPAETEVIAGVVVAALVLLILIFAVIITLTLFYLIKRRRIRKNTSTDGVYTEIPGQANASYSLVAIGTNQSNADISVPVERNATLTTQDISFPEERNVVITAATNMEPSMSLKVNECYSISTPMKMQDNECYGTAEKSSTIPMEQNECYSTVVQDDVTTGRGNNEVKQEQPSEDTTTQMNMKDNECYGTAKESSTIPMEQNECYSTVVQDDVTTEFGALQEPPSEDYDYVY